MCVNTNVIIIVGGQIALFKQSNLCAITIYRLFFLSNIAIIFVLALSTIWSMLNMRTKNRKITSTEMVNSGNAEEDIDLIKNHAHIYTN